MSEPSDSRSRSTVSKTFRLPHEQRTTLKEHFLHPLRRTSYERQQALDDVSFSIEQGEFFGIIGPNGSGKSTLLKILAGIYRQDAGTVRVDGLLSPFIELGVGFNPELTARDNIRINGTLLGLTRSADLGAVRRDRRVRRARALRRPEAEELLVGDAGAARLLDRDPGRLRHPAARRGARGRRRGVPGEVLRDIRRRSGKRARRSCSSPTISERSGSTATARCFSSTGAPESWVLPRRCSTATQRCRIPASRSCLGHASVRSSASLVRVFSARRSEAHCHLERGRIDVVAPEKMIAPLLVCRRLRRREPYCESRRRENVGCGGVRGGSRCLRRDEDRPTSSRAPGEHVCLAVPDHDARREV